MQKLLFLICLAAMTFSSCAQTNSNKNQPLSTTQKSATQNTNGVTPIVIFDTTWTQKITKTQAEWRALLTPEQFHITQEQGTERPFSCALNKEYRKGIFYCVCCQNPLFRSDSKFDSGTGWPSYNQTVSSKSVTVKHDFSHGMERDEVQYQRCGAHLGHVFNDGPPPTGLRYCTDGTALIFQEKTLEKTLSKATFAAGCFWCTAGIFQGIKGVKEVVAGYSGGNTANPTYQQIGTGTTGHAEAFEVYYDAQAVSFQDLLRVYFASINPTQANGQGPDSGTQYRSIIFYHNEAEQKAANDFIANLQKKYTQPVAVEVKSYQKFWQAEDYHQNYVALHPENPYVQQESLPRRERTFILVQDLVQEAPTKKKTK